jgi:flagellar basal-body rod protein FlgG
MIKELYTAAMGMIPQQTKLEVIANNMANANTAGFKRDNLFNRNLIDAKANLWNVAGDAEDDDPPIGHYTDFSNGSMQETFNPLDVAINQEGFFVLSDEEGEQYLSRNGHFTINKDGILTAKDGKVLMGVNGPIRVLQQFFGESNQVNEQRAVEVKVNDNGDVYANGELIDSIIIAKVTNKNQLEKVSSESFSARENAGVEYFSQENVRVKQGWLENSNVDIIKEMVSMIELQRMFEAGSKVISTNDTTLDNSIRLGKYY